MKLYVAAFPFLESYNEWVHSFRSRYDAAAKFVTPHVTLVFPTSEISEDQLQKEITNLTKGLKPFRIVFRSAMLMPEHGKPNVAHIFLVPDEGFGGLLRLHDVLYSGRLKEELRLDIPFVPHMTIGSGLALPAAKDLVDQLNAKQIEIEFVLKEVCIVRIEDQKTDRIVSPPILLGPTSN